MLSQDRYSFSEDITMATLIKIGNKFINIDNVTEICTYELHGWNVIIYYASIVNNGQSLPQQDSEHFTGEEAKALREWLAHNATDVMAWHKHQTSEHAEHNGNSDSRAWRIYSREVANDC